ncbi:hypothetical protein CABS01_11724 [Colletotrichum abscissum]|uniref:Hsp70 family chaperone n=1 Tax=Colletotrichum abscissum TaxID=1671311 RepID=A0A9Q0B4H7_9PEZI|nr:uncharacterized protein CABS01_11724 [Colletotrichum abscissum]KAI3548694.1 hypothetical protein CABS02_08224 [Colletotrichum abscissum]KAK1492827.1 hypothetical protein CABS01_11724 [Colletotrichum abscissum]
MEEKPDLLFGIDVGMTCTGVSFVNFLQGPRTLPFKEWGPRKVADKVPTQLLFRHPDSFNVKPLNWGFECTPERDGHLKTFFKTSFCNPEVDSKARADATVLYKQFLKCLYEKLEGHFSGGTLGGKSWTNCCIHFHFSVPTTWDATSRSEFVAIARQAGFGSSNRFTVEASLPEPHAVAAFTLSQDEFVKDGQSMVVIDAGGGTVDLAFFIVESSERMQLPGKKCGSALIDWGIREEILTRLESIKHNLVLPDRLTGELDDTTLEDLGTTMMTSETIQSKKREMTSDTRDDEDFFSIVIPHLDKSFNNSDLGILNGEMRFTIGGLRALFDININKILDLLDRIVNEPVKSGRQPEVNHIYLSGGLGCSTYVYDRIKRHVQDSNNPRLVNTNMWQPIDGQMVVCMGIVEFFRQSLNHGKNMLSQHHSRVSLGLPCRIKRNGSNVDWLVKEAKPFSKLSQDGKWIEDYVRWFVRKNDVLRDKNPVSVNFSTTFDADIEQKKRVVRLEIMKTFTEPIPTFWFRNELIQFLDSNSVTPTANLILDLSEASPKSHRKKKPFMGMGSKKARVIIDYCIEADVGLSTATFRCLRREGGKMPLTNAAIDLEDFKS